MSGVWFGIELQLLPLRGEAKGKSVEKGTANWAVETSSYPAPGTERE